MLRLTADFRDSLAHNVAGDHRRPIARFSAWSTDERSAKALRRVKVDQLGIGRADQTDTDGKRDEHG
jgi:hypothetical protein